MNRLLFPFYHQMDSADCGPSCLRMIAKHYGVMFIFSPLVLFFCYYVDTVQYVRVRTDSTSR
ncbi:MAG: hypothetical protein IKQ72_12845 [Bacteroidaceae bacterium]|nr:hypothetical protein [Bacteroidaceae bacterium]